MPPLPLVFRSRSASTISARPARRGALLAGGIVLAAALANACVGSSNNSNGTGGAGLGSGTGGGSSSGGATVTGSGGKPATAPGAMTGGDTGTVGAGGAGGRAASGGQPGVGGGVSYPYVFAVFNDSAASSDLIIYSSNDGLNFTLLYDTKYTGPTGFLRDPSIMKHTDGKYYVMFTTPPTLSCCGNESSFAIASSVNLRDWTTVTTVPAGVAGVRNTWAPEWFKDKDGSINALVTLDQKTYRYKAMNDALTVWSAPTFIGIGPDNIDTFVVIVGDTYHAFTKHGNTGFIEHATSTSIDGPWTVLSRNDSDGWGTHKEAPCVFDAGNGTWRIVFDAGSTGHEMYSDSKDMFQTWTAPRGLPVVGNNISHGTVIKGN